MKTIAKGTFLTGLLTVFALDVAAQEWTRFRGPNGTGISYAKTIPTKITEADVNWKVELPGSGHSSPVLWGERLFLTCTGGKAGGISVVCLNAREGNVVWKRDFPLRPFSLTALSSHAASTAAVDAERVYAAWNEPEHYFLTALDHEGKTVWQRDFGTFVSQHGCGTSPIVWKDKVILGNFQEDMRLAGVGTDSGKSSIVAVDAKTGKTVWETPRDTAMVAYSTPCVYEPKGGPPALIFNSQSHGISAVAPDTGKVLWEYEEAFDKRSVSSPLLAGDIIFGSCGSGAGGNFITAIRAGDAATGRRPELAYQVKKSASYVPTGIVAGGLAWFWSDGGILTCLHAPSGEIRYQERVGGNYFGSPVWVDGRLFCVSANGELVVVEAADKFNVLHRYALKEVCRSTPAVALGRMFVRTEKHLWSFGGSKEATAP